MSGRDFTAGRLLSLAKQCTHVTVPTFRDSSFRSSFSFALSKRVAEPRPPGTRRQNALYGGVHPANFCDETDDKHQWAVGGRHPSVGSLKLYYLPGWMSRFQDRARVGLEFPVGSPREHLQAAGLWVVAIVRTPNRYRAAGASGNPAVELFLGNAVCFVFHFGPPAP
jgi:hypothetical protein